MRSLARLWLVVAWAWVALGAAPQIDPQLERELLERFAPSFRISEQDCDVAPAEFRTDTTEPVVKERNGAIYGQAFRKESPRLEGEWVELHYYHLWGRDCGTSAHALDAEHVSGLVRKEAGEWQAVYWYAAAHEDTACDASMAARAQTLDAVERGPRVWVSAGKHASFLSETSCRSGCGADECGRSKMLERRPILPLDARAAWVNSGRWPLVAKLESDFSEGLLGALADPQLNKLVATRPYLLPAKAFLGAGNLGIEKTSGALATGTKHTDSSLDVATKKTAGALGTAKARVKRFLGL